MSVEASEIQQKEEDLELSTSSIQQEDELMSMELYAAEKDMRSEDALLSQWSE